MTERTNDIAAFHHDKQVYSISVTVDPKKFRELCKSRTWFENYPARSYETALEMADTCHSIGDLMILASHIERYSREKYASTIAEWILSECCYFCVHEMEPLPKKIQCKLRIRRLLSRLKGKK